ncbi:uncharacterized protein K452DRAFT_323781 [Aplosporella prunicola CBS 121167]|uniref:C2H2-type domain-containing protein n=1 Tax=Aplosporella prunicola CBS 121167 TaxID=1176127 RepID=A0A6A6BRD7_9PEZI|nr:uncharacterized protein K452DRAFT_323781 [Aplosporella prunicola CBS 121167]KAF2146659.1 hypothetical protein K452DRAFT_323781 [Aplosporella prunicola CBS 121167]
MPTTAGQRTTSRKKSVGDASLKKFACQYDSCGRSFTRSEHLQRHLLNHTAGQSTCERCRAHFKRRDLLERHMARHRQKDAEAGGGEGSGTLNTRKRMWKDADGNIVTKRPNLGPSTVHPSPPSEQQRLSPATPEDATRAAPAEAPISPPISSTLSSHSDGYGHSSEDPAIDAWIFPPLDLSSPGPEPAVIPPTELLPPDTDQFWSTAHALLPSNSQNTCEDVFQDDIFNPDTASSFNMPFTTMSNYNWLFDADLSAQEQFSTSPDILSGTFSAATHVDQAPETRSSTHTFATGVPSENTPVISEPIMTADGAASQHRAVVGDMSIGDPKTLSLPPFPFANGSQPIPNDTAGRFSIPQSFTAPNDETRTPRNLPTPRQERLGVDFERPLSTMNPSASLPVIDGIARAQVLDLIDVARPVTPDGFYISRNHPLLSLSCLQTYCDCYFTRFNTAYPLLHQPTFDASSVETLLLVSVLLIGATYCEKDAHQMAVCIHDVLRPQIFAHAGFTAKPDLWVLQTILLVECFGKSRAGQKQHDMSHLFHGLLINLIRRSDCQTIRPSTSEDCSSDLEQDWREWAEAEQKKRLAYLCFMWDVQHAVLFSQSLCMSAFELRSTLPCNQQLWEAHTASTWQRMRARQRQKRPPLFLTALKSYLSAGPAPAPPTKPLNALSRVLLLHGLMSISWDMQRRAQTSLGLAAGDWWHARMAASYDAWKADFDRYCLDYCAAHQQHQSQQQLLRDFSAFATAHTALYHAAHVALHADLLDLQIYAGARHILGRPVARADYVRSQRVVRRSSSSSSSDMRAAKAAWHAAHILRDGIVGLDDFDAHGLFHYPWTLYLATLTCWAFYHARPALPDDDDDDEMVWDAKAEMHALVSGMTAGAGPESLSLARQQRQQRRGTSGLTAVVAGCLGRVRWAVVHDGVMVLKGLVPWRLAVHSHPPPASSAQQQYPPPPPPPPPPARP